GSTFHNSHSFVCEQLCLMSFETRGNIAWPPFRTLSVMPIRRLSYSYRSCFTAIHCQLSRLPFKPPIVLWVYQEVSESNGMFCNGLSLVVLFLVDAILLIEPLKLRLLRKRYHVNTMTLMRFEIQFLAYDCPNPFACDLPLVVHSVPVHKP